MTSELYWQVSGSGPDIVLVHGWGMNGAVWQQTVDILETQFRVTLLIHRDMVTVQIVMLKT